MGKINIEGINQFFREPKTIQNSNSANDLIYIICAFGAIENPKGSDDETSFPDQLCPICK